MAVFSANGSSSSPSFTFSSDTDLGIYRTGADILSFAIAGQENFRFDANGLRVSTSGSIGGTPNISLGTSGSGHMSGSLSVGTTATPSYTLDVNGSINASSSVLIGGTSVRAIPQVPKTVAYALVAADAGKHISTNSNITLNANVFAVGDAISIYNSSVNTITITQGTSVTLRIAGDATTGSKSLGLYGLCTILCVSSNVFVISGTGVF